MATKISDRRFTEMLYGPMAQWSQRLQALTDDQATDVSARAEAMALKSVRLAVYLRTRDTGRTHEEAVKRQNVAIRGVRASLGFALPKDDIMF